MLEPESSTEVPQMKMTLEMRPHSVNYSFTQQVGNKLNTITSKMFQAYQCHAGLYDGDLLGRVLVGNLPGEFYSDRASTNYDDVRSLVNLESGNTCREQFYYGKFSHSAKDHLKGVG